MTPRDIIDAIVNGAIEKVASAIVERVTVGELQWYLLGILSGVFLSML